MSRVKIQLTQTIFNELESTFNLKLLSEESKAKGFKYKNVMYVVTASSSSSHLGTINLLASSAVPLEYYKGSLVPLEMDAHRDQVMLKMRERGYTGMIVFVEGKKMVMCDEVEFIPIRESNKQLEFF